MTTAICTRDIYSAGPPLNKAYVITYLILPKDICALLKHNYTMDFDTANNSFSKC